VVIRLRPLASSTFMQRKRKQPGSSDPPSQSSMTCTDLCYPKVFAARLRRVSDIFRIRDESCIYYRDLLIPGTISGSGGKEPHCQTLSTARNSSGTPRKIISLKTDLLHLPPFSTFARRRIPFPVDQSRSHSKDQPIYRQTTI